MTVCTVETTSIIFHDLLKTSESKIFLVSELQEISRNMDAMSLCLPHEAPPIVRISARGKELPASKLDATHNRGNKGIWQDPHQRIASFADLCFSSSLSPSPPDAIVVGGHSAWFKTFFSKYLGSSTQHACTRQKLCNAGVVAFKLQRGEIGGRVLYRVRPESIQVVHGHFGSKYKDEEEEEEKEKEKEEKEEERKKQKGKRKAG
ncbi:hypothetical protein GUITHDRAFT_117957 [Guillardia theta CCMP2712]|uniref:Uncharacterized protein n=1 Tax=Guillardia theta (strain CCMP2712) TaxID=905079 RepID=L1IJE2_GUITC|nr:hypothetical protein GUITHDRAFT_117957 [Guillardia theta CCMP2712]EKX35930.1 hypothetical protein GUITHDRAFT_117957 [Guillardia theta CCMP2712]|eukprot:XP_005822910.1 hypothetical protein GUITHDRAFT_117957 [Guillardia theta CCMP2712]